MPPEQYLWEMAVQNLEFCRHHENQRQTLTNFTITAAGALLVIIGLDQKVTRLDLLPASLIVVVGLHGMVTSWKHTELSQFHYTRFRVLRDALDEKLGVSVASLNKIADDEHHSRFPRFRKLSLRQFWFLLNAIISLIGFCLLVIILLST